MARFSEKSFESVGVREIASDAQVDPALVMRYFGSKVGLFSEIAASAFDAEGVMSDVSDQLPKAAADLLFSRTEEGSWRSGYDPLRLLMCSIGSPTAGPILSRYLCKNFVSPIAEHIGGEASAERATIVAAQIIGFAVIRAALSDADELAIRSQPLRLLFEEAIEAVLSSSSVSD